MTDPRLLFALPEIAHISLRGRVPARQFAGGALHKVVCTTAGLYATLDGTVLQREILYGHRVRSLPYGDAHRVFARDETTGYVGFVSRQQLGSWTAPTHRVATRATFAFTAPDFKSSVAMQMSLGAHLHIVDVTDRYSRTVDGQYVMSDHLVPIDQPEQDAAAVAERCIGAPYLWGGNSSFGLDCSGLISLALGTCGRLMPGDSDLQQTAFGPPLPDATPFQRGDLLFWKGHVAMMCDADTLIHANAHHMAVTCEPVQSATQRIRHKGHGNIIAHVRP